MSKPTLCLDFDGVLHSYSSGWVEADFIPDPPVPGAMQALVEYARHFKVCIYSSRSHQPGGIRAMSTWVKYWMHKEFDSFDDKASNWIGIANSVLNQLEYPSEKPSAMVSIDDRGITFDGSWPTVETLLAFKPWNKKVPDGA